MLRLPPVEKLPLAIRKNVRDNWEAKKADYEAQLSQTLRTAWTININTNAILPYARLGTWARESLGSLVAAYVDGVLYRLDLFRQKLGEEGLAEINRVASARVLTMDVDEAGADNTYNGVAFVDGHMVLLFNENNLGTNVSDALEFEKLAKALSEVMTPDLENPADSADTEVGTAPPQQLSFRVRAGLITADFEKRISETADGLEQLLGVRLALVPNLEEIYARLLVEASGSGSGSGSGSDSGSGSGNNNNKIQLDAGWEDNLGSFVLQYFDGLRRTLGRLGFSRDCLMREAFVEAVDNKNTVALRIVDATAATYNEVVIDKGDGTLYIQTTAKQWGVNIDDAASEIIDVL